MPTMPALITPAPTMRATRLIAVFLEEGAAYATTSAPEV
jgi:hypothetical protein